MGADKPPRPAYMVDVDESTGKQVRGTVRSATTKEKPKLSQRDSRSGKPTKKSQSDAGNYAVENSSRVQTVAIRKEKKEEGIIERRKSISESAKSPRKSTRPPSTHANHSYPKITVPNEDPSYYGVSTPTYSPVVAYPATPLQIPYRPRATTQPHPRPTSYHQSYTSAGSYAPPLSNSAYFSPSQTTPYPPASPSSNSYMRYAMTPAAMAPEEDYFTPHNNNIAPISRPLSARFDMVPRSSQALDPINRTASAFGTRDTRRPSIAEQYDNREQEDSYVSQADSSQFRRRESIRVPSVRRHDDPDYMAMPPPPRPGGILRRPATEYPSERTDDRIVFRGREDRSQYRETRSPRRPSANRNSMSYDFGKDSERVKIETANKGRRRQSYYGQSASGSSGYEDKVSEAAAYQEDVGGATIPLTAEVLRRQQRQGGSSRSTKSSDSRDESDYKKSATTRTTRSGSGNDDENVTIKVTGQARVMVGGTQIDCNEGGVIQIERQKSLRNGSERSSSEYGGQRQIDDRRSRIDKPATRTRMSSTSSYIRPNPQYAMDNYL